ncbi:MAG TPA: TRAP transporter large permease subunit [Vicinamibacteria bacterium]|nr:TRAP transporter large permease subunit [Vicinamibacteria bacterium]
MNPAAALRRVEHAVLVAALLTLTVLPLIDALGRPLTGFFVPGGAAWVQQLTLWLAFVGGLAAAGEGKHLMLSTAELFGERLRPAGHVLAAAVSAATVAVLTYASVRVLQVNRAEGRLLPGGIPEWLSELVMPVALGLMALRFAWGASTAWRPRLLAFAAIPVVFALGAAAPEVLGRASGVVSLMILAALVLGAPVFVAMGSLALLFFLRDGLETGTDPGTSISAVLADVYRLVSSPTLPAIPLLTGCGYVLAESGASQRLLRFFRALLGFVPGGLAVIVIAVCALFTTFTGGSGVTIIALGGLVYPMLREDGYPEGFSLGLVTAAGSLGLLFPPSLPVILYSVVAGTRDHNVPADGLYLAGLLPGALMVAMVAAYAIRVGSHVQTRRQPFAWPELGRAFWAARWELSLPPLVIGLFASGWLSMVETAAAALAYAIVVECILTRDLHPVRTLPAALVKSCVLTGSVLILLSAAMGITSYIVDAQIPEQLVAWVKAHIHSPIVFLLALNALLIVVGCLVDIFSAIVVLAPLIAPMGAAFGVDPVHQGVIFLANLELGFLTPPVGLNLYLSSSRFGKPLTEVARHAFPFLLIMAAAVLIITYVPALSVGVLRALGRG